MSVDVNTVPPWKQALLEKKRLQDNEDIQSSNKEAERISSFPAWKRDILVKKHHTKNSVIFLGDPSPPKSSHSNILRNKKNISRGEEEPSVKASQSNSSHTANTGDEEDHLPTFGQNPWLKADAKYVKKKSHKNRHSDPTTGLQLNHVSNHHSWPETDVTCELENNSEITDEVFRGDEVTYGRGFVHKLLKRFSHMSNQEEPDNIKSKRSASGRLSRSSENLLDDKAESIPRALSPIGNRYIESLSPRSPTRSRSTDSLTSPRSYSSDFENSKNINKMGYEDKTGISSSEVISQEHVNDYEADISVTDSGINNVSANDSLLNNSEEIEDLPKRNTVSSTRNVFETIAHCQPNKIPETISQKGHVSKSVHSLIAVDTLLVNGDNSTFEVTTPTSPSGNFHSSLDAPLGFHTTSVTTIHHVDGPSSGSSGPGNKPVSPVDGPSNRFVGYSIATKPVSPTTDGSSIAYAGYSVSSSSKPNTVNKDKPQPIKTGYVGYSVTSKPSLPKKDADLSGRNIQSRSSYFSGAGVKPQNKTVPKNTADVKQSSTHQDNNANDMNKLSTKDNNKSASKLEINNIVSNSVSTGPNTLSQSTGLNTSKSDSPINNETGLNGHVIGNSVSDKISAVETLYPSSLKKRKAPSPPNQAKSGLQTDNKKHVTSISLTNSSSEIKNVQPVSKTVTESSSGIKSEKGISLVEVTSSSGLYNSSNRTSNHSDSNQNTNYENSSSKKAEASRQNLSLNLNNIGSSKVESPKVVSSKPEKENPLSVIHSRNKKAKFKVPKAGGPGSLLIRPASNMVLSKNPQFVHLEFKYNDIKKGKFAPAKKRPAYYDEYSDSDESDEDIPVTNIDDVLEGSGHNSNSITDANANVPKKTKAKKYDFIGQMVVLDKSSIRSRNLKANIEFNDSGISTYEYPSQQSLLDSMPPEHGDFDHPDTVFNTVSTPSDEEIPDMEEPTQKLMSTPGIGSAGSLAGYQTKMQVEFSYGMNPMESDSNHIPVSQRNGQHKQNGSGEDAVDSLVKPADEEDTFQWSENKTSDLLF